MEGGPPPRRHSDRVTTARAGSGGVRARRARGDARAEDTGGAIGLVEGSFYQGFGPPLHIHWREDEAFYVLEGEIRVRQGDDEFAGPGTWVWGPRGVPHAFKVESEKARALILVTPGGFERMFEEGGIPLAEASERARAGVRPGGGCRDVEEVRLRRGGSAARVGPASASRIRRRLASTPDAPLRSARPNLSRLPRGEGADPGTP